MNDLLHLKGVFEQKKSSNRPGSPNIPLGKKVNIEHLRELHKQLNDIFLRWNSQGLLPGALLSIEYIKIVAKSNRVRGFLAKGKSSSNSSIVGAKFITNDNGHFEHVITHYVSLAVITETINILSEVIRISEQKFDASINYSDLERINENQIEIDSKIASKSKFVNFIVDAYYVSRFFVDEEVDVQNKNIVTLYDTQTDTITLLSKLGIAITRGSMIGNDTLLLTNDQLLLLKQKAPFLISMATTDISQLTLDDVIKQPLTQEDLIIPPPQSEPCVGAIDTMFDENVYFSEWVEFHNMVNPNIEIDARDYVHGTAVSSIIVDGPALNPSLDDGCGRFRVRHFGVACGSQFSSFSILKSIEEIILSNRDIKVWNLSLGSRLETNINSISPEAAILDRIQYENDVIFVIAGTNRLENCNPDALRVGAPADSINSLVVNSVNNANNPASYTRTGPVLSFFIKPDISYYGGDNGQELTVYKPFGKDGVKGTSFAAPWITRKMSYLIDKVGLSREVAKALLIDAASGWSHSNQNFTKVGYGVVPNKIDDIVKSNNYEIKFFITGTMDKYELYNYGIPVPMRDNSYPFVARATLCYFPHCSRNQGVDYTSSELNIKFGRIENKPLKDKPHEEKLQIKSINNDTQDNPDTYMYEESAREHFRKWDNVKHIKETFTGKNKERKTYSNKMWGIKITKKERDERSLGKGIAFGAVITLREIKGVNRIEDFINQCSLRGWLVSRVSVESRIEIHSLAEEEIVFEN